MVHLLQQIFEFLVIVFQVLEFHEPLEQCVHVLVSSDLLSEWCWIRLVVVGSTLPLA